MIKKFLFSLNLAQMTVEILFDYMKAESFRGFPYGAIFNYFIFLSPLQDLLLFVYK